MYFLAKKPMPNTKDCYLTEDDIMSSKVIIEESELSGNQNEFRNKNFKVYLIQKGKEDGLGMYFIKQPKTLQADKVSTIRTEGYFYHFINNYFSQKNILENLLEYYCYDQVRNMLILKYGLIGNFSQKYSGAYPDGFDYKESEKKAIIKNLGSVLKKFKSIFEKDCIREKTAYFDYTLESKPALLNFYSTYRTFEENERVNKEKLEVLWSTLYEIINGISKKWVNSHLIHYDLKKENILIKEDKDDFIPIIIDWELVGFGDPIWDLVGGLYSFLFNQGSIDLEDSCENIKSFLSIYQSKFSEENLIKIIEFLGVKILSEELFRPNNSENLDFKMAIEMIKNPHYYIYYFKLQSL